MRWRVDLHADAGCGFIHDVDGFVRQEPVCDITVGKNCCRNKRRVRNLNAVEYFVTFL